MHNHEPADYRCPMCLIASGGENSFTTQADIVRRTDHALAFISSRWWPNNHGHVLVVPSSHHENLYDLPARAGHAVHDLVREIAIAVRATYNCTGISTRQHNEPDGYHDVWHFHTHVFPRYPNDNLYATPHLPTPATPPERAPYSDRLKAYFDGT